jgi:hypothetical protein
MNRHVSNRIRWLFVVALLLQGPFALAGDQQTFEEGRHGEGELKFINDLPVLVVAGTPEEMGRQKAVLTANAMTQLAKYPKMFAAQLHRKDRWEKLLERAKLLVPQFPPDQLAEIRAFGEESGIDRDIGLVGNTLADIYRGGFACSSLIVEPNRSATDGPIFGRNLDFYTLGLLDKFNLVTVHRPVGKHAFVSIGFPGLFGCLSGMNDTGLSLAVHEVYIGRDNAPIFNPKGVPYTMCFRRILEECSTVAEAEALLRSTERTTILNLAVCDRTTSAVLEMTPKTVVRRPSVDGICVCTNHFRSPELYVPMPCPRYDTLMNAGKMNKLGIADVAKELHEVNMGVLTVQTMIFEPAALRVHVGIGSRPASALPLKPLDLAPLFRPEG